MKKERNGGPAPARVTWRGRGRGVRPAVGPDCDGVGSAARARAHVHGGKQGREGPGLERERRSVGRPGEK
jgi:hypothetical protein